MQKSVLQFFLLFAGCFLFCQLTAAQNADINFVRAINPEGEKSFVFRGLSASVYPISVAIPAGNFIYGELKRDKQIKIKSYDEAGSLAITAIITSGLKIAVNEQRPYEKYSGVYPYEFEKGKSFPSAHAAISFATAAMLTLQYKKWYVIVPAYVWATGCSFSRIYLGEHYPSDVIAGALIGTGSAFLSHWITKRIFVK